MNVWVIAESAALVAELVTGAKQLGATEITAFAGCEKSATVGASKLVVMPLLPNVMWEAYAPVIAEKAKAEAPAVILVGATKRGKEIAAQLAALLDAPCISDCKSIAIDGAKKTTTRMIYGGMAVKTQSTEAPILIATIGAKTYEAQPESAACPIETLAAPASAVVVTAREPKVSSGVNLSEAAIIVAVGRGFVEKSELKIAEDLAKAAGGEMACSRPIAEFFKWMPEEAYVGISGQIVKPQLYIACGISGQAQHISGMRDSKIVVAINKDENAPINAQSDYYIVGDVKAVLPEITKAVAAR